ncbi:MAG TPA: methyltransferase [Gemmatimonadaceae bacterium]|jgi:SAM-dependent methyltransferase|nr:methyltransferase [Gemmatimonadaceae bacterium]
MSRDSQNSHPPRPLPKRKTYDRAYYDRWYRHPRHRAATPDQRERKVRLALSVAEYVVGRPVRSVLDVGCGEGAWFPILKRLRPDARYIGVDPSDYVVRRFGAARHIKQGSFVNFDELRLPATVDLVVCADVLQYVASRDVVRGLTAIRRRLRGANGGVAYIEAYTTDDDMVGDRVDWHDRTAAAYRRLFRSAGLTQCGPQCYTDLDHVNMPLSFDHFR